MIDHVPKFSYRGRTIEAWCEAAGVSAWGPGRVSNAFWEVEVNGDSRYYGFLSEPDDDLESVTKRLCAWVDAHLDLTTGTGSAD